MSKSFRYWVRCTTVATLTVLLTFNPAWAGRGLLRLMKRSQASNCVVETTCCAVAVPCVSAPVCCDSAPVVVAPMIESSTCCCGPAPVMSSPLMGSSPLPMTNEAGSIGQVIAPATTSESETTPKNETPKSELSPSDAINPVAPLTAESEQPVQPPAPAAEVEAPFPKPEVQTPPAVELPAPAENDPFGAPSNPPADTIPADTVPADNAADPFGTTPPAELPAAPAANDPFGAPAPEAPAVPAGNDPFGAPTEPAPVEPDLFGNPPADTPAPAGADDPFGAPAAVEPAPGAPADGAAAGGVADLFGGDAAAPAPAAGDTDLFAPPAVEKAAPAADGADLFGNPAAGDAPAPAGDGADLFGPPPAGDAPAADDPFSKPTSTINSPTSFDELFGVPADPVGDQPAASNVETSDKEAPALEADPFAEAFKSTRVWRDNTGSFEVTAVLAEIHPDKVRLLKDNGKYTSVPLHRLNTADRQMVEAIAHKLPAGQVKYVSTK